MLFIIFQNKSFVVKYDINYLSYIHEREFVCETTKELTLIQKDVVWRDILIRHFEHNKKFDVDDIVDAHLYVPLEGIFEKIKIDSNLLFHWGPESNKPQKYWEFSIIEDLIYYIVHYKAHDERDTDLLEIEILGAV